MKILLFTILFLNLTNCFSQIYEVKTKDESMGFSCFQENEGDDVYKITRADHNGTYKIYKNTYGNKNDLRFIADIKDKQYDGLFEKYWKGHLEIKGQFSNGKRIGKWTYFNDSSKVSYESEYHHDTIYTTSYLRDIMQNIKCSTIVIEIARNSSEYKKLSEKKVCIGEINKVHAKLIETLNEKLSNEWKIKQVDYNENREYGNNTISFTLFTLLTAHPGGNEGVSLYAIDKCYKEYVLRENPKVDGNGISEHCYFETKSYIILADYFSNWHEDLIKSLMSELDTFFKTNKNKL